jgi:hypothetical protein
MANPFSVKPLVEPGFFRRLFRRPNPENGYIELENLLATTSWSSLHEGTISAVLQRHGVRHLNRKRAQDLFTTALTVFTADDEISDSEAADLQQLRNLLGITSEEARSAEEEITLPRYQRAIYDVLRDEHLSDEEKVLLTKLRKALRIDDRVAIEMWEKSAEPILTKNWQAAITDRRLSTDEQDALAAMARNFSINVEIDSATRAQLDRFRWFWLMENGTFPEIQVPINLQKKEVCHFSGAVGLSEMRTETQRINYGGPVVRIKIMKGLYYRAGSVRVERVTRDILRQVDSGVLYVTNKRVIFDGARKNTTIRLSSILSITPYADAVEIEKTSGRNPFFTTSDAEWLTILLSSRLAQSE